MKKLTLILAVFMSLIALAACTSWRKFDYSDAKAKFKAEQMIKIADDDKFDDFFECKVWATKRTLGIVLPTTKQENFEGYIAIPDGYDVYIFIYDLKGDYKHGDYSECKIVDFNDTPYEEFKDAEFYIGHYRIDKIHIKAK